MSKEDMFLAVNQCKTPGGYFVSIFSSKENPGMNVDKNVKRDVYIVNHNKVNSFLNALKSYNFFLTNLQLKFGIIFDTSFHKDKLRLDKILGIIKLYAD